MRPLNSDWHDAGVISSLRRLAASTPFAQLIANEPWLLETQFEEASVISGLGRKGCALAKLDLGAKLEEVAVSACERAVEPGGAIMATSAKVRGVVSQLYFDAYAAAVWTSAHAEYVAAIDSGDEEPTAPSMFSVPCAFTSYDLSEMYARRAHPKTCAKHTAPLLQLLARCTNPGARGWDPVLELSLKQHGIRRIVMREVEICLTGMHPQLHPALRPNWQHRFVVIRSCSHRCSGDAVTSDVVKLAVEVKEIMRRALASTMTAVPAMQVVLSRMGHPVRHLHEPPLQLPHPGMEAAMAAFISAGMAIGSGDSRSLFDVVRSKFDRAKRRPDGLQWAPGWLGKGTMDLAPRATAVAVASDIWSSAFKTNFISFWMHGMSKKLRVSRLDPVQHEAIHGMNAATQLCASLPESDRLKLQRLVLTDATAGTKTLQEVASAIGIAVATPLPNSFKTPADALGSLSQLDASDAARILAYARVAWLREHVVSVNLGETIARRQATILMRRMRRVHDCDPTTVVETAYETAPTHATCLCICTECQRVANAHVSNGIADKPLGVFNEIGVSQSMIRWPNVDSSTGCLHCAKRSSAALRTAISFQEYMSKRCVEDEEIDEGEIGQLIAPRVATSVESGISARVRRDAKNAMEQRAVAASCADSSMLTVKLIGRALRIYDSWYALCGYCAAVTKVTAIHRYGAHICCLRCDHTMLYRNDELQDTIAAPDGESEKSICRFCGSIDPEQSGARWKRVKAPLDVAGPNAALPPPLRKVWYCPKHYRSWVPGAHRVLPTRVVLAHLATNAKPISDMRADDSDEEEQKEPKKARKRQRRLLTAPSS